MPPRVLALTSQMTSRMILVIMQSWKLQDAKARFSELIDTALRKGPQIVTRRGEETAVVVPIEEWRRLKQAARPDLKTLLLQDGPRFDFEKIISRRRRIGRRRVTFK